MRKLIAMTIAVLAFSSSTLAGGIFITNSGKKESVGGSYGVYK